MNDKTLPPKEIPSQRVDKDMTETKYITEIQPDDVLLGRGAGPNEHKGNVRFRLIVAKQKKQYMDTTKRELKNRIAIKTLRIVKAKKGRFLQKVNRGNKQEDVYVIADDKIVLEKTKQALRHLDRNKAATPNLPASEKQTSSVWLPVQASQHPLASLSRKGRLNGFISGSSSNEAPMLAGTIKQDSQSSKYYASLESQAFPLAKTLTQNSEIRTNSNSSINAPRHPGIFQHINEALTVLNLNDSNKQRAIAANSLLSLDCAIRKNTASLSDSLAVPHQQLGQATKALLTTQNRMGLESNDLSFLGVQQRQATFTHGTLDYLLAQRRQRRILEQQNPLLPTNINLCI